jgi:PIN domain nuclease of toxin-antitoxin system
MSDSAGYLLDSHVLLWWWFDPERLSEPVQTLQIGMPLMQQLLATRCRIRMLLWGSATGRRPV